MGNYFGTDRSIQRLNEITNIQDISSDVNNLQRIFK